MSGPIFEILWESIDDPLNRIINPTWKDIEERVRYLEIAKSGSVFLKATEGSLLSIGGDRGKGYLVFVSDDAGNRYLEAEPAERKGTVRLVIGFQPADYPRRIVVSLEASLRAARTFFDGDVIKEGASWTADAKTVEL